MPVSRTILEQIKKLIPALDGTLHKGQSGRVGVLGGAQDYTGAPFFSAISALRFGADLSHVICSPTAAGPIKSYSPDLIVHPILDEPGFAIIGNELRSILSRLHVLIVGPGLGREDNMQYYADMAISLAKERGMYVVIDADGLNMIVKDYSIIKGYRRAVITPNVVEFKRLSDEMGIDSKVPSDQRAALMSKFLGGVTVLQKGAKDIISSDTTEGEPNLRENRLEGVETVEVDVEGGLKRCGGQGDVLSGCVGTILAWGQCYQDNAFRDRTIPASRIPLLAAIGGSMVTRTASRRAFSKQGRSVVTQDMIPEIGKSFQEVFDGFHEGL